MGGTSGSVMFSKVEQQTYTSEFESHWLPHSYVLGPHLSEKLSKLRLSHTHTHTHIYIRVCVCVCVCVCICIYYYSSHLSYFTGFKAQFKITLKNHNTSVCYDNRNKPPV